MTLSYFGILLFSRIDWSNPVFWHGAAIGSLFVLWLSGLGIAVVAHSDDPWSFLVKAVIHTMAFLLMYSNSVFLPAFPLGAMFLFVCTVLVYGRLERKLGADPVIDLAGLAFGYFSIVMLHAVIVYQLNPVVMFCLTIGIYIMILNSQVLKNMLGTNRAIVLAWVGSVAMIFPYLMLILFGNSSTPKLIQVFAEYYLEVGIWGMFLAGAIMSWRGYWNTMSHPVMWTMRICVIAMGCLKHLYLYIDKGWEDFVVMVVVIYIVMQIIEDVFRFMKRRQEAVE